MKQFIKTKILHIITNPLFLAIPLTVLILILLPPLFKKYKGSIENIEVSAQSHMSKIYYIDLDHDGFSEKIKIYIWQNNSTAIEIYDHGSSLIDHFNFDGFYHYNFDLLHGDYDNNGKDEIYFFTQSNDSVIHINQLELLSDTNYIEKRKFITIIKLHNKKLDSQVSKVGITDLNDDGFKEVLFHINSGYSLQPRNIYAWDIKNDSVLKSPKSFAKLIKPKIVDIQKNEEVEIISSSSSSGNTKGDIGSPFHDNSAWLMIFDKQLKFKYKPIEYKGYGTNLYIETISQDKDNYFVILEMNVLKGKEYAKLSLLDDKLKLIKERKLDKNFAKYYRLIKPKIANTELLWLTNYKLNQVELLDFDLQAKKKFKSSAAFTIRDIDLDGNDEILYWNVNHDKLSIARSDFSHPVEYSIPESMGNNYMNYCFRLNGKKALQFAIQRGNKAYLLNYQKNSFYLLKYPFYIVVYFVFVLFFYLIQKVQKKRIEQKYATERELIKLQIQTIKNQTDPHFIFNALNAISSAIYREDKDTAYDFLNDFSSLIRATIINSDKIQISLQEEIEFIENYLRLEKLRFKEKFDYKINIDEQVDINLNVPRMVLQSYIENAIKHGIMHADYKCLLEISLKNKNSHLEIIIDDNGVGREKAKKYAGFSMGKGLQIMNRIYELYDKLHQVKIIQTIEDKKDKDGKALGTRVRIEIPLRQ